MPSSASEEIAPLGPQRPRRPDLLTGDPGSRRRRAPRCLHVRQVGPRVGLAEPLAPPALARCDQGGGAAPSARACRSRGSTARSSSARSTGRRGARSATTSPRGSPPTRRGRRRSPPYSCWPVRHEQANACQHLAEPVAQLEVGGIIGERAEPSRGEMLGDQARGAALAAPRTCSGSSWTKASEESSAVIVALRSSGRGHGRHYRSR